MALNFQTPGPFMELQDGKFLDNGGCGYVLKPAFLRDLNTTFTPRNVGAHSRPMSLSIRVRLLKCCFVPEKWENKRYLVQMQLLSNFFSHFNLIPVCWELIFSTRKVKLSYNINCCYFPMCSSLMFAKNM